MQCTGVLKHIGYENNCVLPTEDVDSSWSSPSHLVTGDEDTQSAVNQQVSLIPLYNPASGVVKHYRCQWVFLTFYCVIVIIS